MSCCRLTKSGSRFEFISKPGERPDVVCLCAKELRTGRTLRLWRNQLGAVPPYRVDAKCVVRVLRGQCRMRLPPSLGWPLPARVLDLSPEFRNHINGRPTPEGKGLIGALAHFGIDAIGTKHKDAMRKRILQGWPFTPKSSERDFELLPERTSTRWAVCCRRSAAEHRFAGRALPRRICRRICRRWSTAACRSTWRFFRV